MARRAAARRRDGRDPRQGRPLRPQDRRIKAPSGHKVAIGAIKHAIVIAIDQMLKNGELYHPPIVHPEHRSSYFPRKNGTPARLGVNLVGSGQPTGTGEDPAGFGLPPAAPRTGS